MCKHLAHANNLTLNYIQALLSLIPMTTYTHPYMVWPCRRCCDACAFSKAGPPLPPGGKRRSAAVQIMSCTTSQLVSHPAIKLHSTFCCVAIQLVFSCVVALAIQPLSYTEHLLCTCHPAIQLSSCTCNRAAQVSKNPSLITLHRPPLPCPCIARQEQRFQEQREQSRIARDRTIWGRPDGPSLSYPKP